jgi:hypothetical protein
MTVFQNLLENVTDMELNCRAVWRSAQPLVHRVLAEDAGSSASCADPPTRREARAGAPPNPSAGRSSASCRRRNRLILRSHPRNEVRTYCTRTVLYAYGTYVLGLVAGERMYVEYVPPIYAWYGMVWCPSYSLDRNRCDQVVAAGSGAS